MYRESSLEDGECNSPNENVLQEQEEILRKRLIESYNNRKRKSDSFSSDVPTKCSKSHSDLDQSQELDSSTMDLEHYETLLRSRFDSTNSQSDDNNGEHEPEPEPTTIDIRHSPPKTVECAVTVELNPNLPLAKPLYYPAIQGCRFLSNYEFLNKIEEGTYGEVFRAKDRKTKEIVALKRLKMENEKYGFPITSLREVNTLMKAQHENIVTVREVVVGNDLDSIYLVMDFVEHDLKSLMKIINRAFEISEVKCLMLQLLEAIAHLHDNWIIHRDLKTSNLLLSHNGVLKVADFGLAREYGSPLKSYTSLVVTLWYRAPELLLGQKMYSTHIDMWSVGCIFGELLLNRALFAGKSEIEQIQILFRELGVPNEETWPGVSELPMMKKINYKSKEKPRNEKRLSNRLSGLGKYVFNK